MECMEVIRMKKYEITMVSVGFIWAWVILATIAVLWSTWPVLEMLLIEAGGAIACLAAMQVRRPSAMEKPPSDSGEK